MTVKALDKLAKEKAPMPVGLALYEQCYYIATRGLYDQYEHQLITLEQAKREKEELLQKYNEAKAQWTLFMALPDISLKLNQLKEDPFNTAIELEVAEALNKLLK